MNNAAARAAGLVAIAFAGLTTGSGITTAGLHQAMTVSAALLVAVASAAGIRTAAVVS
ncbi:hypothetical protein [Pseudarthrobacter sp. N5]|uniref:hypothetical protein n=1 Tax=Pseudarthrobacter sp. N5 TaxID=3418416 RepID=UPI003CF448D0